MAFWAVTNKVHFGHISQVMPAKPAHENAVNTIKLIVLLAIEAPVACLYILMMSAKFRMVVNCDIEASRTIAGALTRASRRWRVASGLWKPKTYQIFGKSANANYSQIGDARSHLKLSGRCCDEEWGGGSTFATGENDRNGISAVSWHGPFRHLEGTAF